MLLLSFSLMVLLKTLSFANGQWCDVWKGTCRIENYTVNGLLNLTQTGGLLEIFGSVQGLSFGEHGFHLHQFGDLGNGCNNAGEHYNPTGETHGGQYSAIRHRGDLGNINAGGNGVAPVYKADYRLHLCESLGRALVVHAMRDDLGVGSSPESKINGNSGKRIGCCIVNVAKTS